MLLEEERLEKKSDQPTRTETKTGLEVRTNLCLSSGDYSRALDLLRGAAGEFPDDAEFLALEKLAQDGIQRKAEANRLITESQELFAQHNSAKAIELLRQAYALDKNNSLPRSILANALVEHAHSILETDWWEAETLANEALTLNPAHPTGKTIQKLVLDQKTTAAVDEWVSQTHKLEAAGNLSAALSQIAEGLSVFPHDARLLQVQDEIQRDYSTHRRQARRRDLDDLRRTASELDTVVDIASKAALAERIRAATIKYSTDGEILSIANALLLRLGQLGVPQKTAAAAVGSESATTATVHRAPPPSIAVASVVASIPFPPQPIPVGSIPIDTAPPGVVSPGIASPKIVPPGIDRPSIITPGKVPSNDVPPVKLPTTAPEPQPDLPQTPAASAVEPLAEEVKLATRPSEPKAVQRTKSIAVIVGIAAAIILVAAVSFLLGRHQASPVAKTSTTAPVAAPSVFSPAVSVPTVSPPAQNASAPTTPEPPLPASTPSSTTAAGNSTLAVTADNQSSAGPASSAFIDSGHNLGMLLVIAGQDDAVVFLNGKRQAQLTQAGQLRIPNLELKDYVVQVSKSGFQDPPQQRIRIRKGEPARLIFDLQPQRQPQSQPQPQPQARLASLTIQGGVAGTAVLVDQTVVGTIPADGTISVSNVIPGDHSVELRKDGFKPRQFKRHFDLGGTVSLVATDSALEALPGELKITFTPTDAKVAIVKGESLTMVSSGVPLNLSSGTYTLTARTVEMFTRSSTLEVPAGQLKTVDLSLAPNGMSNWDDPDAWKEEGESFVRRGGDFVLYGATPGSGTFVFSAVSPKGHPLQWVVNYIDSRNYVLYQMDDDTFYRAVVRNGAKTDEIRFPDKADRKGFRQFHIRVSPTEIVHQIRHGNSWTILDRLTQRGTNLASGKFGFYLPGNDKVAVSSFAYYADLNIR